MAGQGPRRDSRRLRLGTVYRGRVFAGRGGVPGSPPARVGGARRGLRWAGVRGPLSLVAPHRLTRGLHAAPPARQARGPVACRAVGLIARRGGLPNKALQLTAGARGRAGAVAGRRRVRGGTRRRRPNGGKVGHGRRQLSADPLGRPGNLFSREEVLLVGSAAHRRRVFVASRRATSGVAGRRRAKRARVPSVSYTRWLGLTPRRRPPSQPCRAQRGQRGLVAGQAPRRALAGFALEPAYRGRVFASRGGVPGSPPARVGGARRGLAGQVRAAGSRYWLRVASRAGCTPRLRHAKLEVRWRAEQLVSSRGAGAA